MTLTTVVDAIERELLLRKQNDKLKIMNQMMISKTKKIEEQRMELEAIIESVTDGISIVEDRGHVKLFNESSRETFAPPFGYLEDFQEW
ncbi:hypothetical protein LGK95_06920 [Clostridium algoriphilum]|uniref:hypothetical protein n=1 Tax=Clostridium algoriphilum TaxID=198347 RepID=UPI001CF5B4EC|nr:hypothetical protein [Clostridium algoriphilum]MCB2293249.1 hypothetical protein [Clostridium algoriphilum]